MDLRGLLSDELAQHDLWYWTKKYRIIKGKPWDFGPRTYLKQLYRDKSQEVIIVKGRQTEMSEFAVNKALHFADTHPKTTLLYAFPNSDLCGIFGNLRIKEAIFDSPSLARKLVNDGSVGVKSFKNGAHLYLRTAFGGGDKARSIAADALFCDEYQDFDNRGRSDVPARDVLMSNLDHSEFKVTQTFGTPKLRDSHFEQMWHSSTMNYWHVRCEHCQKEQILILENIINWDEAWENDDIHKVYYGCRFCKKPLNRFLGNWFSTNTVNKNATLSGYHINQLMVPWKAASDILLAYGTKHIKGKSARGFYNEVMGEFYSGSDQPFNETVLERCYDTSASLLDASMEATYLGIDWGDISTACLIKYNVEEDHVYIVGAFKFTNEDMLCQVRDIQVMALRYHVDTTVADFGYGRVQNAELLKKFPGRVWACVYSHSTGELEHLNWDAARMQVRVDREDNFNLLVDRAEKGSGVAGGLTIPRDQYAKTHMVEYLQEMKNVIAVQKWNRTIYERIGSGDHFAHALGYAVIAAKRQTSRTRYAPHSSGVTLGRSRQSIFGSDGRVRPGSITRRR